MPTYLNNKDKFSRIFKGLGRASAPRTGPRRPQGKPESNEPIPLCYNCNEWGHVSRDCPLQYCVKCWDRKPHQSGPWCARRSVAPPQSQQQVMAGAKELPHAAMRSHAPARKSQYQSRPQMPWDRGTAYPMRPSSTPSGYQGRIPPRQGVDA